MPIVEVTMFEGRDEETKARLTREVAAVVSEVTQNSLNDVHVLIKEMEPVNWGKGLTLASRRERTGDRVISRPEYASVSRIQYNAETEDDYLKLRSEVINPGMATQPGFVDCLLLRPTEKDNEYLLVIRWLTQADDDAYDNSDMHENLRKQAMSILPHPLESYGAHIVHADRAKA